MKIIRPDAAALLDLYDVAPLEDWRRLELGEAPPVEMSALVGKGDAVRHVADTRRRRAAVALPQMLEDHTLCADVRAYAGMCKPILVPERYAFQLDVHRALFSEEDGVRTGRSGIVVCPCGSGKTHIGVNAALAVRRPVLVVSPSNEAVSQWKAAFSAVGVPVRVLGERAPVTRAEHPPAVTLTTYKLLALTHDTPFATLRDDPYKYELLLALYVWRYDLLVLDEVWTTPAETYLRSCAVVDAAMRLGLTADERRSDGKQETITAFVGPVRYEMTPQRARELGIIATTRSRVVEVPMSEALRAAYASADAEKQRLIAVLNPHKIHRLVTTLGVSGAHKVVVFCDKVEALAPLADVLRRTTRHFVGTLAGNVSKAERIRLCDEMRRRPTCVALFSKVGNAAVDVPGIDLVVEVSVVDRAAQQKTQRDGRAQRVCEDKEAAEVVTLVSSGTREVDFARTRVAETRSGLGTEWEVAEAEAPSSCPWPDAGVQGMLRKRPLEEKAPRAKKSPRI